MQSTIRVWVILISLAGILSSLSAQDLYVAKDLQGEWMVYEDGGYRPFENGKDSGIDAIYFWLDVNKYRGQYLQVEGRYEKALFVNGKLKKSGATERMLFSVDSLGSDFFTSSLLVGIYTSHIHAENLNTAIMSPQRSVSVANAYVARPETFFRDFVFTGIFFLLTLLMVVVQLTKIPLSFFYGMRLFSIHESEEAQLYTRIGSTTNVLFYVFCSLVLGFYLSIAFHFLSDRFLIALQFYSTSYLEAMLKWGKLSMFLLVAIFIKIGLVLTFSRMFGMTEFFGFHVVNWIRLLLVVFGMLTLVLFVYFISRGIAESVYAAFFWSLAVVLTAWLIILFTRVARRSGFSLFHIFSYLCATELIPLLISVKLLYH